MADDRMAQPTLPLFVAAGATWTGAGTWLTERLQPGNDLADALVFQAFAANFLVLMTLWIAAVWRRSGASA